MTLTGHLLHTPNSIFTPPTSEALKRLRTKTSRDAMDIIELTNDSWKQQYIQLITDEVILDILEAKPTLWFDLQQKMRKYLNDADSNAWDGEKQREELMESILSAFLVPEQSIKRKLEQVLEKDLKESVSQGIIQNTKLLAYIKQKTPISFIEYPTTKFSQFTSAKQVWNLMERIIRRNTGESGIELKIFNKIFIDILENIRSIFGIDICESLPGFRGVGTFTSLTAPAEIIYGWLTSKEWRIPSDATLFLRALYAWGDIKAIKEAQVHAKKAQKKLFFYLERLGWVEDLPPLSGDSTREQQRTVRFNVPLANRVFVPVIIDSGIKSIRSILIKLYADEKYNNFDVVNDLLGVRVLLEEVLKQYHAECEAWFSRFMGRNAFIFKDKGLADSIDKMNVLWQDNPDNKAPVLVTSKRKARSSDCYRDCKYSWYMSQDMSEKPVGIEIQFFANREDPSPKGEAHHSILNAGKVIQGWVRGEHMITAKQVLAVIHQECLDKNQKSLSGLSIQEIFWTLIKNLLVPYTLPVSEDRKMVVFWVRWYERLLMNDYPRAHKVTVSTDIPVFGHSGKLGHYIDSLISTEFQGTSLLLSQ